MNKLFLTLALLSTSMLALHADWTTDYKAALAQAKTQNKQVLLDFTGSDWCPNCQLLHEEVFSKQSFRDFADKNYILVTIDFPQEKQLPKNLQEQNEQLREKFDADGLFPVLIVVNADGKELGRQLGYVPSSGPEAVISKLKSFTK